MQYSKWAAHCRVSATLTSTSALPARLTQSVQHVFVILGPVPGRTLSGITLECIGRLCECLTNPAASLVLLDGVQRRPDATGASWQDRHQRAREAAAQCIASACFARRRRAGAQLRARSLPSLPFNSSLTLLQQITLLRPLLLGRSDDARATASGIDAGSPHHRAGPPRPLPISKIACPARGSSSVTSSSFACAPRVEWRQHLGRDHRHASARFGATSAPTCARNAARMRAAMAALEPVRA